LKNQKQKKEHPFIRLQTELTELISKSKPGDKLLNEPDLAMNLGVSRATLREAMRAFEGQGLIRRRQGVGTFVVSHTHTIESGLEVLESIETQAKRIGLEVSMGNLKLEQIDADKDQAEYLVVKTGTKVIKITRVIIAENRPVAYLIDLLPADILTVEDLKEGFTGSVLDWLLRRGTPLLANSSTEIQAIAAHQEVARALQIQRGDVLLKFIGNLLSSNGRVIDHSASYFLPGYFRFHVVRRVNHNHMDFVRSK